MKINSYIKNAPQNGYGSMLGYSGNGTLVATIKRNKAKSYDAQFGKYTIYFVGGIAHGKSAYGQDKEDVADKVAEYVRISKLNKLNKLNK